MRVSPFYTKKPVFGLDIGHSSAKILQLKKHRKHPRVSCYGHIAFSEKVVKNGVIQDAEAMARILEPLFKKQAIGKLTSNRVVASIPISQTFTRVLSLPMMHAKDIEESVKIEAEQYIPVPVEDLYLEHAIIGRRHPHKESKKSKRKAGKKTESNTNESLDVLLVATPRVIIDSYIELFRLLKLEVAAIEPGLFASIRTIRLTDPNDAPRIVIDFGAQSSDLAIYDGTVRLTSTIDTGGDDLTEAIKASLGVDEDKARHIKYRYGIGPSQSQDKIVEALLPALTNLSDEVQKMLRYYHERADGQKDMREITIIGGGASLPGLSQFLTQLTGLKVEVCNPWPHLSVRPLQPPHHTETTLYVTATGLGLQELMHD